MSISLANSLIYQELSDMKDNLELLVKNRTIELHAAMEELEATNETLTRTNRELEVAQMTARKDMEMAKNVQASILQLKPPITSEFDIAVSFKPMAGVSGDLYDFYERDGKLLGLAIFDVSGHGIASGLITMIVRSIFRRHFFEMEDRKLNAIVETANIDLIKETEHGDQYLSGIFLRFNGHQVEYVNAGHPDIYYKNAIMRRIYKVNKKTHDFKGLFLGSKVLAKSYEVIKFQFESEDALLLYTDCLIEGKNKNNIEYSETRLKETFNRAPDGTAREILDFMLKDFNGFIGDKKLNDDLTVIIVKRKKI